MVSLSPWRSSLSPSPGCLLPRCSAKRPRTAGASRGYVTQRRAERDSVPTSGQFWQQPVGDASRWLRRLDRSLVPIGAPWCSTAHALTPHGRAVYTSVGDRPQTPSLRTQHELPWRWTHWRPVTTQSESDLGTRRLSVYVPVTYGDRYGGVYGVAQVEIPWATPRRSFAIGDHGVGGDLRRSLLLAWLLLFRVVHRASVGCANRRTRTSGWRCTIR